VRLLAGSLGDTLRYSVSDCFSTFPFPAADPRETFAPLAEKGKALYEARARFMAETSQGLTDTYNALKDSECVDERVVELRCLHEAMDRSVLDAYGWSDVEIPPFCPMNEEDEAGLEAFTDEVVDRLYLLNSERAAEERRRVVTGTAADDQVSSPSP
jgi:hypothetical protein